MLPHLIAICGHPLSGKSEVQKILASDYGVIPVDDGMPMRQFGVDWLGLSWDDVLTQEGKCRRSDILGRNWVHREILGEIGKAFEAMFGRFAMPFMATRKLDPRKSYSFGSVRRDQGSFYKELGGVVIGINNPNAKPSPYEFDQFDPSIVDHWIENDALARGAAPDAALADLRAKIAAIFGAASLAA